MRKRGRVPHAIKVQTPNVYFSLDRLQTEKQQRSARGCDSATIKRLLDEATFSPVTAFTLPTDEGDRSDAVLMDAEEAEQVKAVRSLDYYLLLCFLIYEMELTEW